MLVLLLLIIMIRFGLMIVSSVCRCVYYVLCVLVLWCGIVLSVLWMLFRWVLLSMVLWLIVIGGEMLEGVDMMCFVWLRVM